MNRAFSRREKVMLGVLVVLILGAVYYFLTFQPLQARIAAAEVRSADAQDAMLVEETRAAMRTKMLAEIASMKAAGQQLSAEIPLYNNLRSVMQQLNTILGLAQSYDIGFSEVEEGTRIIKRPIQISFTAKNYADAKKIVLNLSRCRYRCTIDSVDVSVEESAEDRLDDVVTQPVRVNATVTFYEKNTTPPPPPTVETVPEPAA
ncbi:MAG: type II secretion system protein GspM [Oscillospiraceae bacterium]